MTNWMFRREDGSLSSDTNLRRLPPKAARVLECLLEGKGSVLSRSDILEAAWPGLHVSPDLVRENIFEIRKALGDNASAPKYIETVGRQGFRLIGPVSFQAPSKASETEVDAQRSGSPPIPKQVSPVTFCASKDGTSVAHAASGAGYPLLIAGSWMSHLDKDWESPSYSAYLRHLSERFRVIRYDQRGNGLSQWSNVDISFERMVDDMEAVVDASGHAKLAILGMSQGASVAIAYALRQPGRVSHLVLKGGYARGRKHRDNDADREESDALVKLIRHGWGNENPAIRQTLTTLFMPDATKEQMHWFNEFQKLCGPAENIAQFRATFDEMNVTHLLPNIKVPTLVIHSERDSVAPLTEGKLLASQIQCSSFVQLNSANHMLFETERDFAKMIESIDRFITA